MVVTGVGSIHLFLYRLLIIRIYGLEYDRIYYEFPAQTVYSTFGCKTMFDYGNRLDFSIAAIVHRRQTRLPTFFQENRRNRYKICLLYWPGPEERGGKRGLQEKVRKRGNQIFLLIFPRILFKFFPIFKVISFGSSRLSYPIDFL